MLENYKQYSMKEWAKIGKYICHHGESVTALVSKAGLACVLKYGKYGKVVIKFVNASSYENLSHLMCEQLPTWIFRYIACMKNVQ